VRVRTNDCYVCNDSNDVLYRCRYQELTDWVFLGISLILAIGAPNAFVKIFNQEYQGLFTRFQAKLPTIEWESKFRLL